MKKISQVTGINEAAVASTHRYLRDAGLITKGGRGTSSAKMTALDASKLLIALLAATAINDSPDVVEQYGNLSVRRWNAVSELERIEIDGDAITFVVCVQALFEAFLSGELAAAISNALGKEIETNDLSFKNVEISISVYRPEPRASVHIAAILEDEDVRATPLLSLEFERSFLLDEKSSPNIKPAIHQEEHSVGLKECRWIGLEVVRAVSEIL